ncbi:MAG: hypothetical protein WC937_03035 [Candidatus Omnitrophota bacterium]|jgi:hypothetical protein
MIKIIKGYIYKYSIPLSVTIICIYALFLRLIVLYRHTLWTDEIYYLGPLKGTFLEFIREIPKAEFCSYLSGDLFIFFPFFKIFAYNKWALATPCIISTVAGFYLLYLICKIYFRSIWAYLITFCIVCFNASLIVHATEIRTYAFLPTLALATFYLLKKLADLNFELSTVKRIWATIFFVLVIWFHVYGVLMFGSCLLFVLIAEYKNKNFRIFLKNAIYFAVIVLCSAMPLWLYSVLGPHLSYTQFNINPFDFIPSPWQNFSGFLKGIFGNLIGFKKLYIFLLGTIVPVFFSYENRFKQLFFLILIILFPIGVIFIFDLLQKYWFIQRQFVWVMPFYAFFLGWCWESLFFIFKERVLLWKIK